MLAAAHSCKAHFRRLCTPNKENPEPFYHLSSHNTINAVIKAHDIITNIIKQHCMINKIISTVPHNIYVLQTPQI